MRKRARGAAPAELPARWAAGGGSCAGECTQVAGRRGRPVSSPCWARQAQLQPRAARSSSTMPGWLSTCQPTTRACHTAWDVQGMRSAGDTGVAACSSPALGLEHAPSIAEEKLASLPAGPNWVDAVDEHDTCARHGKPPADDSSQRPGCCWPVIQAAAVLTVHCSVQCDSRMACDRLGGAA